MFFYQQMLEGLGCFSYMLGSRETGVCAVVDPQRDIAGYLEVAAANGLTITHVIETHTHADHVSGCQALAAATGATICIHANANAGFAHRPLQDGDRLTLGECQLDVLFTPGHTLDSICLLVTDTAGAAAPMCMLTGDTLLLGDVGRPDLVPGQDAGAMAALLYDSLHTQLLGRPDELQLYPGHGAGSLCARSVQAGSCTTLGHERQANQALQEPSPDAFVRSVALNLPQQPANFRRIKQLNQQGAPALAGTLHPLAPAEALALQGQGHALVDIRSLAEFSQGHARGAVNIAIADSQFASRVGYLLPPDTAVILLGGPAAGEIAQAAQSLARVGYDRVAGYVAGGFAAWQQAGLPAASVALLQATPGDVTGLLAGPHAPQLVDVREPWEWDAGHLAGAIHIPLGQLDQRVCEVERGRPVVAYCRGGVRSQIAAALLAQRGHQVIYNLAGGIEAWRRAGYPVAASAEVMASAASG